MDTHMFIGKPGLVQVLQVSFPVRLLFKTTEWDGDALFCLFVSGFPLHRNTILKGSEVLTYCMLLGFSVPCG